MDTTNLVAWLPFDDSTTQDLCGNTWTTAGNPTIGTNGAISGKALQLSGSGYLQYGSTFNFTGQPFTVSCRFSGVSNTTGGDVCLWQMYIANGNRIQLEIATSGKMDLWKDSDNTIYIRTAASVLDGQIHHAECDFDGSTWYLFLDGVLVGTKAHTCTARNYSLYIGLNYQTGRKFTGTIDEFQIYDGVALHTANFTPPTAEDYFKQRLALTGSGNISLTFDVARRVSKRVAFSVDVARVITNSRFISVNQSFDVVRNIVKSVSFTVDVKLAVNRPVTFDIDVARKVKKLGKLRAWLPFDKSVTEDICGNTWTTAGNPSIGKKNAIVGNALQLDGQSYLKLSNIMLGGQDFYIDGWVYVDSSSPNYARVLSIVNPDNGYMLASVRKSPNDATKLDFWANSYADVSQDNGYTYKSTINSVGERVHFKLIYRYSDKRLSFCINDVIAADWTAATKYNRRAFDIYIGNNTRLTQGVIGSVDELRIYDGTWFSYGYGNTPTADDYIAQRLTVIGEADISFNIDVQRNIKNASLTWRYVNLGTGDDMIISSVNHYDLPATKSITGIAFGQLVRAKCFDIPATDEIWLKFDVYFDGSNRWRAFNGGDNSVAYNAGVTAQTNGMLSFVNLSVVQISHSDVCKVNQLQTVLLHMVSGATAGVVEAWVDGDFIYRYTGNVNNGNDFADIYLQSDGSGTFFSNVLISNARIGLDDGYKTFSADVVRRVKNRVTFTVDVERYLFKPIHVPLIGEHFCHFVKNRTLHRGVVQRIILPKNSKVYVRASDEGTVKIFSDTDNSGVTTDDIYAELDECNTVFIEYAPLNTSLQVIKNFMFALSADDDTLGTLNAAINYCTNGSIPDITTLANQLISDLNSSASYTDFLRDYCDIILDNADTGAIIGSDAGSGTAKTAENIVPENIPVENWIIPEGGSVVTIDGLSVHFPTTGANGILSDVEKHILAGLNSVWIKQSLKLINKSFGLNFNSADVYVRDIDVSFIDDSTNSAVASVAVTLLNNIPDELELIINMAHCQYIDLTSADGLITRDNVYLDRILAHEFTHAVMASNISFYSKLPNYIREGAAELVHGIDDLRREEIITLLTTYKNSFYHNIIDFDDILLSYAAGYVILRYLSKQGQRDIPLPTTFQLNNLLISNGATDSDYNVLTDNTRQIFSADVARTLAKRLSFSLDVTIRDVIRVSFTADVARAILAELILFPINTLLRSKSSPRFRASQQNTQGLQSFEVNIGEQQITEQINFAGIIPFDILQQVNGQYLDYHFNMRVEKVQQEGIIYRCECCSDLDQLLFTQLAYKIPPTTWRKVGADDTTVEIETYYPPATAHVQKIASALGLTPVMQFDNFLSTVLMDDLGGVTYNDLIRDVFGWSSRIPHQLINCYIRDGKLYVIQRGHEANIVDISNAKCTMPIITKELVRTTWGSTPWSKTKTTEFQHTSWQAGVPDDVTIGGGSSDTGGGSTLPSGDDQQEQFKEVSTQFSGHDYQGNTTYTYDRNGLLVQTYIHVEKDINGRLQITNTTVTHGYDDDNTMIYTETFVQSYGAEGESSSRSIEEKGYTVLPNGEKFLAWESSTTYQNDEGLTPTNKDLVDSKVTVHSPSRVGQTHTITIGTDGEIVGSAAGQNTGDDRVTPFSKYKTAALGKNLFARTSSSISGGSSGSSSGGSGGEWTTETETYELTTNGLSLYDSSFPIHNESKLIQVTQALRWLNRKTQETLTLSVYEFPHLIDFNDRIIFNGNEYFLVNNTATTTPRIFNEQNLTLRRWY